MTLACIWAMVCIDMIEITWSLSPTTPSTQGHLIIIGPREKQCTGAHTSTTTHRNKTVNVDKIKHIFIVLVLPTKSVLNIKKKNAVYNIPKLLWGPRATAQHVHALRQHCLHPLHNYDLNKLTSPWTNHRVCFCTCITTWVSASNWWCISTAKENNQNFFFNLTK